MNNYYLKIADIKIHVKSPFKINMGVESKDFISDYEGEDILLEYKEVKKRPYMEGRLVYENIIKFYETKEGFVHELYPMPDKNPYAWITPINKHYYEVRYLAGEERYIDYSRNIIDIMNIEQVLNTFNAFILHSSFIKWQDKAIIFSAPSGTGKSTQADLWEKYENAEIINGDRTGIRKMDGKWTAYGLPIAGSSGIYKNKKAEISHIIVLKQGKENKLTKLSPREAFVKLYSETLVHTWDKEFQENIINMITDVVQNVQIYQYECLPDKSAVDFLKEQIIKDRGLFVENIKTGNKIF